MTKLINRQEEIKLSCAQQFDFTPGVEFLKSVTKLLRRLVRVQ